MKKYLCMLLCVLLALSGVSAMASDEQAFAPYDETVSVHIGRETVVSLDLPDGDDQENNKYNDYIENALNIDITYD